MLASVSVLIVGWNEIVLPDVLSEVSKLEDEKMGWKNRVSAKEP